MVSKFSPQPEKTVFFFFFSLCIAFLSGLGRGIKMAGKEGLEEGGGDSCGGRDMWCFWSSCFGLCQRGLSCRAGHHCAVAFVSTTILTSEHSNVFIFSVLISQKQTGGVGKHLFYHMLESNSCFL